MSGSTYDTDLYQMWWLLSYLIFFFIGCVVMYRFKPCLVCIKRRKCQLQKDKMKKELELAERNCKETDELLEGVSIW